MLTSFRSEFLFPTCKSLDIFFVVLYNVVNNYKNKIMSLGENRKIAIVVISIFVVSIISVVFLVGKDHLPSSGENLKIDVLDVVGGHGDSHGDSYKQESVYRKILENTEDPVFAIETDGTIAYLSSGFEAQLGYDLGELKEELFFTLISEKDLPSLAAKFTELIDNENVLDSIGPFRINTKDGDHRYILISATHLEEKDHSGKIVGTIKDITESIEEFKEEKEEIKDDGPKIKETENIETEEEEDEDESRLVVESIT
jgi:PAS domain S-box-containing protein